MRRSAWLHGSLRARTGAAICVAAGILAEISVFLPHWEGFNEAGVAGTGMVFISCGLLLFALRERISGSALRFLPGVATLLVCGLVWFGGGRVASASFAMVFVWITVYCAYFLSRRALVATLVLSAVSYGLVLSRFPAAVAPATVWVFVEGTAAVVGSIVATLAGALRDLARIDPLTGLANRRSWDERLALEAARATREGSDLGVVLADLDGFKRINDELGHAAGDELLQRVGRAWSAAVRQTDLVARWGGDEFAVLLPGTDRTTTTLTLDRLRAALPEGARATFGSATWDRSEPIEDALRRADRALYAEKRSRRGARVTVG